MTKRRIQTKKILVASLGVASISYAIACGDGAPPARHPPGNLMPPDRPPMDLPEPDAGPIDAATTAADVEAQPPITATSGNLMAPVEPMPVTDAGAPRDAGAATKDAGAKDGGVKPPVKPPTVPFPRPPTSGNLMAPVERPNAPQPRPKTK